MKKTIFLLLPALIVLFTIVKYTVNVSNGSLMGPGFAGQIIHTQSTPVPTPEPTLAPPVAPKTYNFDSSTDLKAQLDKVNPQILDSDFQ